MICTQCKHDRTDGTVQDGKFVCTLCEVSGLVYPLVKKSRARKDWQIVNVLKAHGIRGNMAAIYADRYGMEYLVRKVWQMRYMLHTGKARSKFMMKHVIEQNYNEPDHFLDWMKSMKNGDPKDDWKCLYG